MQNLQTDLKICCKATTKLSAAEFASGLIQITNLPFQTIFRDMKITKRYHEKIFRINTNFYAEKDF